MRNLWKICSNNSDKRRRQYNIRPKHKNSKRYDNINSSMFK